MLFKSALLTQASGSVGGVTFSHNRGGMYTRARTIPTDPASEFQTELRASFGGLAAAWGSILTQAQRDAWDLYADNVTVTNPLGDQIKLSGQQWYVKANAPRLQAALFLGVAASALRVDDGPTTFNLTSLTAGQPTLTAPDGISQPYVADESRTQNGGLILVYQGRPQSSGRRFYKGPFRLAGVVVGDTTTPPTSPLVIADPDTPFTMTAGQVCATRVTASAPDARPSNPVLPGLVVVG